MFLVLGGDGAVQLLVAAAPDRVVTWLLFRLSASLAVTGVRAPTARLWATPPIAYRTEYLPSKTLVTLPTPPPSRANLLSTSTMSPTSNFNRADAVTGVAAMVSISTAQLGLG